MVILSFFLSQGIVAERGDNCCPVCYAKLWETNLSFSKFLLASFLLEVLNVCLWYFYCLFVSLRFSLRRFRPHGNTPNKKRLKTTCLDTMIGGHSKFLLVTGGGVAKRDDNRCPALQSFEERACSAAFVVPALCWCCGSFQIPCASFFWHRYFKCVPLVFLF